MSVDISYHAFSPSKADEGWKHFAEDIVILRKHSLEEKAIKDKLEEFAKKTDEEYKTKYEPELVKKRKEIFKSYENEGLYIPDVDWNQDGVVLVNGSWGPYHPSDQEKMEYLLNFGMMYPKGYGRGDADKGKLMYKEDKQEYLALQQKVEEFRKNLMPKSQPEGVKPLELAERQKELAWHTDYLCYELKFDRQRLLYDLKMVDLNYGSIEPELPDSPAFFEPVIEEFDLIKGTELTELDTDKQKWFDVYNSLDSESIRSHALSIAEETGWEVEECEMYIRDFFIGMKPLIKILKDNPDALLMRQIHNDNVLDPKAAEDYMIKRAEAHIKEFKGILPPVL